jgi:hypothetical protein
VSMKLCWQCNKKLYPGYVVIKFNESRILVHKACKEDAENLLFKNKVTFMGEEQE